MLMRRNTCLIVPLLASLGASALLRAQAPGPVVELEVKDGRTHFRLGDAITLELVFSDPAFPATEREQGRGFPPPPGRTSINDMEYPDLAEDISISPATGWTQWREHSGHDYIGEAVLNAQKIRLPLVVNQGYVFRQPGHYELRVTTQRVRGGGPITTNSVGIDIEARSPEDEAALVKSLEAEIASSKGKARLAAAENLAYLTGDDAARAKVRWLLSGKPGVSNAMEDGLASTRNQGLQLKLLKEAWDDPRHSPDDTLDYALANAERLVRGEQVRAFVMWGPAEKSRPELVAALEEHRADVQRMIASLPQRTGASRRDTAYFLIEGNKLTPEQKAKVKAVVLEEFTHMDPMAKSMLVETKWEDVKDASLLPALRDMVDDNRENVDRATALQRLIELNPDVARPYVLKAACGNDRSVAAVGKIGRLKDATLPGVDECLAEFLNRTPDLNARYEWQQRAMLAARYGTAALLPALREGWNKRPELDSSVLPMLIRYDTAEALAMLKRQSQISLVFYEINTVYEALGTSFPPPLLAWLREQVASTTENASSNASYWLSMHGTPEDKTLLEHKLEALRQMWHGREGALQKPAVGTPEFDATLREANLASSLHNAKAWTLSDDEALRLQQGCMTEGCRSYLKPRVMVADMAKSLSVR